MLFATSCGGGAVMHSPAPKRYRPELSRAELRLIRAHSFEVLLGQDIPLTTVAHVFQFAESTVKEDLEFLRAERLRRADADEDESEAN